MDTWVFYVDESGDCEKHQDALKNGQTPLFALAGVALPMSQWRRYSSPNSLYTLGIQNLSLRFDCFLQEKEAQGIIIVDSRMKKIDSKVTNSYLSYLFGNENGKTITRLQEPLLFGDSKITVGLQIADNISAGIFAHFYQQNCSHLTGASNYAHVELKTWPKIESLEYISQTPYDRGPLNGKKVYGYWVFDFQNQSSATEAS